MANMLNAIKKFALAAAVAVLSISCAKPGPIAPKPPEIAVKPEPPKFQAAMPQPNKPAPPFSIQAVDGWNLVNYSPLGADEPEPKLVAIFENALDEETSVRAAIIQANLNAEEAEGFLEEVRTEAHNRDNARVLKERITKLGNLRAYEIIEVRAQGRGPQLFVTLVVTDGKLGFVVTCGGSGFEEAERTLPLCAEFVESFRVKE